MQTTIDDRRIGYETFGQGPPLVLMHAFPLNRKMFAEQCEALGSSARIITFDAPGVGNSEPGSVSVAAIADIAAGLLDALQVERAVIGGVSMGGYAAFAFARKYPDRLAGLLLASTKPAADTEEAKATRREMAAVAREKGSAEVAKRMLPKLLGETSRRKNRRLTERVRGMIEATPPEVIAALLNALAERSDSSDLLPGIAAPALVIAGAEDTITTVSEAQAWASQIPGSRFAEISRAGHLVNMEAPKEFNRIVQEFLGNL